MIKNRLKHFYNCFLIDWRKEKRQMRKYVRLLKEVQTKDGKFVNECDEVYSIIEPDKYNGFISPKICAGDELEINGDGALKVRININLGHSDYNYWEIKKVSECYADRKILERQL